jgi:23S rRNA (cytidine2498-2'-O)-methyltransferase
MTALFLHCRPGFESECAAEIQELAAARGIAGYCKAKPDAAYAIFQTHEPDGAARLHRELPFAELIFIRQWFVATALCSELPPTDRITPLLEPLRDFPAPVGEIFLETPDTNEGKELSGLCRALERPLQEALRKAKLWQTNAAQDAIRLHVCILSGSSAYVGYAMPANSAPWSMGIPRLKFPRGAPSRSTLKLEEAFLHFLSARDREALLQPGMSAVDLGAAPGGWTWQLLRRHLRVAAVDNGALAPELLESGAVEHVRVDGFRYQPSAPVDWMVCDIVEQPIRIAELAAYWIARGWCARTIFNLKLPMKKRYQEVRRCVARIDALLHEAGVGYELGCKQLYHDREEVTVYLRRRMA